MTKHEADVIGGLNMTDQISNEAYKRIMIAAQDENEVGDVLDKIRAEIQAKYDSIPYRYNEYDDAWIDALEWVLESVIDKHIGKENNAEDCN